MNPKRKQERKFFYPFFDEIWLSKVFVNCFTTQESHPKDTQLLTFKFPKSFLIWSVKILSLKTTKKLKIESFYSTQTQAKSCNDFPGANQKLKHNIVGNPDPHSHYDSI